MAAFALQSDRYLLLPHHYHHRRRLHLLPPRPPHLLLSRCRRLPPTRVSSGGGGGDGGGGFLGAVKKGSVPMVEKEEEEEEEVKEEVGTLELRWPPWEGLAERYKLIGTTSLAFVICNMDKVILPHTMLSELLYCKRRANIERLLQPIKGTWKEKGASVVSDGWSESKKAFDKFYGSVREWPMFLKAVNCEGSYKNKFFIANLMKEVVMEIGPQNMVQIVTNNAPVCKSTRHLIEAQYPHIFWTPYVVHTLNLALKNICVAKNTESNETVYAECHWIIEVADRALQIKIFITNHSMRLPIYNQHSHLKLLSIAETRFASTIIMLKRFKVMKNALQSMVIFDQWASYRDDVVKAQAIKTTILDDLWWDKVDYISEFTSPIYEMLRFADTDKSSLHLVYDMWDSMIEKVTAIILGMRDWHLIMNQHFMRWCIIS